MQFLQLKTTLEQLYRQFSKVILKSFSWTALHCLTAPNWAQVFYDLFIGLYRFFSSWAGNKKCHAWENTSLATGMF